MEVMIELTEFELQEVAGGQSATVSFAFAQSASGPNTAAATGMLTQTTTVIGGKAPSATAAQSGTFSTSSS
jgi:hypothetical protein